MTEEESQKSEEKLTFVKTKREDRIWDRKKKKWTLFIWTDGGRERGRVSCAMVVGRKRKTHQSWRAIKATSSTAAELEAIKKAMSIRTDTDTTIFTDSQAAIKAIESRPTLQKDKRRNENATIIERIRKLVDSRIENGWKVPEIIWIPGHTDGEKEMEKKKRADTQLKALYKRFELEEANKELEKGNIVADKGTERGMNKAIKARTLAGQPKK
jgi:ribonuclease HI